jgi:predicted enzyme related to lactoylglutathione lyase
MTAIKKVAFTYYLVENIERARIFYEEIIGLKVSKIYSDGIWIEYDLPEGGCFVLYRKEGYKPESSSGGQIAFEVDNLLEFVKELRNKNVKIIGDMISSPVCEAFIIEDSEGNHICLHQIKKHY